MKAGLRFLVARPLVQLFVLLAVFCLPWLHQGGWTLVKGNFYAWNMAGLPLADPLGLVQGLVGGGWPALPLWIGAGLVLLLALLLGRVFCGWMCPYGFLSELVWKLWGRAEGGDGGTKPAKTKRKGGAEIWGWRVALTALGLLAASLTGAPLLNQLSAPGLLSLAPDLAIGSGGKGSAVVAAVLGALAFPALLLGVEIFCGRRLWCRYLCPQALALMLAAALGAKILKKKGLVVRWTGTRCSCHNAEPCAASCSLALRPRGRMSRASCVHCGICVRECAKYGAALQLSLEVGTTRKQE